MGEAQAFGRRSLLVAAAATFAAGCTRGAGGTVGAGAGTAGASTAGPGTAGPGTSGPTTGAAGPSGPRTSPSTAAAGTRRTGPRTDPRAVAARATVPVLCWHQLRPWKSSDSGYAKRLLICPPRNFTAQLDAIQHAGCTTISPDQYLAHLTRGVPLPAKPVLLTFDDAQGSQISVGLPELTRRGMTATFFIMTVVLDRPGWMSRDDVRRLHRAGMTVAAHTWDHHRADRYRGTDWRVQLDRPRAELEHLVGRPVRHFAYPYGAWSTADFPHLAAAGYSTAFQLSDRPLDPDRPLYTLRRTLVDSTWGPAQVRRSLTSAG